MSVCDISPLTPAYLLVIATLLFLLAAPLLAARYRCWLALAAPTAAGLALALLVLVFQGLVGSGACEGQAGQIYSAISWLDVPAITFYQPALQPLVWGLLLVGVAITLAAQDSASRISPYSLATVLAMVAMAYCLTLAANLRTLALCLFAFDIVAALFLLANQQKAKAVGHLFLGVLSATIIMAMTHSAGLVDSGLPQLGGVFSITIWLRLGLYPLMEIGTLPGSGSPMRLGWIAVNLMVGLFLLTTGTAEWIAWPALLIAILHGVLSWLEPHRQKALLHTAYALAGSTMVLVAAGGSPAAAVAVSLGIPLGLLALTLTPHRLGPFGRPDSAPGWWPWLASASPLLATLSWMAIPFTLGWYGRGLLYQEVWSAGEMGMIALLLVAGGTGLAVFYRYWLLLTDSAPSAKRSVWRPVGAALAIVPFLIPFVGPRLVSQASAIWSVPESSGADTTGLWVALIVTLLWAAALGAGRPWLLKQMPFSRDTALEWLQLEWLLNPVGLGLGWLSRALLRVRAIIEGEHYLAWALLLTLCLVLLLLFYSPEIPY